MFGNALGDDLGKFLWVHAAAPTQHEVFHQVSIQDDGFQVSARQVYLYVLVDEGKGFTAERMPEETVGSLSRSCRLIDGRQPGVIRFIVREEWRRTECFPELMHQRVSLREGISTVFAEGLLRGLKCFPSVLRSVHAREECESSLHCRRELVHQVI